MANLSQIKRQKMFEFLNKIKDEHKDDDETLIAIGEIENELNSKKYGLVWEKHEEQVDVMMQENIPVFTEVKEKEIKEADDMGYNFLLEGDNLHSLKLLEKTHKGKIDVIYIDPPYNTSNSLTYDDKRISKSDSYLHSKWLSFMESRLLIAKRLLDKEGIMFLSIDDNEGYQLKLLCDEIFGEENFMGSFAVIKAEGGGMAKYIIKGHDILFVYAKDLSVRFPLAKPKDIRGKITNIDGVDYWIQEDSIRKKFGSYGNLHYEEILEFRDQQFKDKIDEGLKNHEYILVPKDNGMNVIGKLRKLDEDYSKFYSVIKHLNSDGVNQLKNMGLDTKFDYPKPLSLVQELVEAATFKHKNKYIILDFFAGSGTTGEAVIKANQKDGKNRQFILCTNNEVSTKQKLEFVKEMGYLKDYYPNNNTTDSAIENKIEKNLSQNGLTLTQLIDLNFYEYEKYGIAQAVTYNRMKMLAEGFTSKLDLEDKLYEKNITINNIDKLPTYISEIEMIKSKNLGWNYKEKLSDSKLQLFALKKSGEFIPGVDLNLKYFKTEFISKNSDDVTEELLLHIKEMVELENGITLDNKKHLIVLSDEEADSLEKDWNSYTDVEAIYVSRNVLFTTSQNELFRNVEIHIIPDYYFEYELKEAGESW